MRAVIQRVSEASVSVDGRVTGRIGPGLLVLLGVGQDDSEEDARLMADKGVDVLVRAWPSINEQRILVRAGSAIAAAT